MCGLASASALYSCSSFLTFPMHVGVFIQSFILFLELVYEYDSICLSFINNIQIIHHHKSIVRRTFRRVLPRALSAGPSGLTPAGRPQVPQLAVIDVAQE